MFGSNLCLLFLDRLQNNFPLAEIAVKGKKGKKSERRCLKSKIAHVQTTRNSIAYNMH